MSNWKDKLKNSQGGGGSKGPRLDFKQHFQMKQNEQGVPCFTYYAKKENGEGNTMFLTKPLKGIYLGHAMKISAYCDNLGRNGGSYKSDYYFNNQKVTLFDPVERKKAVSGSMEEVEQWISTNTTSGRGKKSQVLFILTKTGLITITTNLSLCIDQLSTHRNELSEKFVKLEPTLYNKKLENITPRAKEYLGKFADKNPPVFANISMDMDITDEAAFKLELGDNIEKFIEWKEFKLNGTTEAALEQEGEPERVGSQSSDVNALMGARPTGETFDNPFAGGDQEDDDLPF